ncbi:MAG: superoxide dismutase [Bifidobacteriaceae bacterium]|jgi:Fe-Mn family superoxide dismutase|nr:superoxide dismutase [Bifidobacteriaceae bacterium]
MSVYTLPDLTYDYSALEPNISARIMELHHSKHHAAYVAGANTALEQIADAEARGDYSAIGLLQKNLAFNLAGHVNHTIFWTNLSPDGGGDPEGALAGAIGGGFGSAAAFRAHFSAAATSIQGSGWAMLAWEPLAGRLLVEQVYDHQSNVVSAAVPLLLLDMWEHAFYLDYQNVKADYVKAFWNIVDWSNVADRLARAQSATAGLIA